MYPHNGSNPSLDSAHKGSFITPDCPLFVCLHSQIKFEKASIHYLLCHTERLHQLNGPLIGVYISVGSSDLKLNDSTEKMDIHSCD